MKSLMVAAFAYSDAFKKPPRPLAVVLGQMLARTPMGDTARMCLLGRIFNNLRPGDKLRCQAELQQCRLAKRWQTEATVT